MARFLVIVLLGLFIHASRGSLLWSSLRKDASSSAKSTSITVVTDTDAAPFVSLSPYGVPYGFAIELMDFISCQSGLNFVYEYKAFDQLIPTVQANRNIISISDVAVTAAREKLVDFAQFFRSGSRFLVPSGSNLNISGLNDLCGKTVVVQKGTTEQDDVEQQNGKCSSGSITIIVAATYSNLVAIVQNGSADVGVYDQAILVATVAASNGKLKIVGQLNNVQPYGILCNKNNSELCCQLVDAINKIIKAESYESLLERYSFTYKDNGVCPSRINLSGRSNCTKKDKPTSAQCKKNLA